MVKSPIDGLVRTGAGAAASVPPPAASLKRMDTPRKFPKTPDHVLEAVSGQLQEEIIH